MMVEVARLGKPLAIFALPKERRALRWRGTLGRRLAALEDGAAGLVLGPLSDALHRLRIAKYARDLSEIHRRLYARGLAVPLGQRFRAAADAAVGRPCTRGRARARADGPPARVMAAQ